MSLNYSLKNTIWLFKKLRKYPIGKINTETTFFFRQMMGRSQRTHCIKYSTLKNKQMHKKEL